jgi:uncharacterized protein YacL
MRTREIILIAVSVICLMIFTLFLFDYYIRTEETKVLIKNVYYDSLLLEEQKLLKEKDSIILGDEKIINSRLNNHEVRIKKLEHTESK